MKSEAALQNSDRIAESIRAAFLERLKEEGHGDDAKLDLFSLTLMLAVEAGDGDYDPALMAGLEEEAASLIETGISGRALVDAILQAGEKVFSKGIKDASMFQGLLRAQRVIMHGWERVEQEKRDELERRLCEIDAFPDTIAATLDPSTLARKGLEKLKEMTGALSASLYHLSEKGVFVCGEKTGEDVGGGKLVLGGRAEQALLCERRLYEGAEDGDPAIFLDGMRVDFPGMIFMPLAVRERTTGLIMLELGPESGGMEGDVLSLARRLAGRLAVALENAGLHAREQRKIREMVALLELTRAINSTLDLEEILDRVARMSVDLCDARECVVYLWDAERRLFVPESHCGFMLEDGEEGDPQAFGPEELDQPCMRSLGDGVAVTMRAHDAEALISPRCMAEHGVETAVLYPLRSKRRLTGIMALFYPATMKVELEWEAKGLTAAIAAQASMAIENACLYEDIEKSYYSTIKALAKAIEVKDPYTHGHSERVTEYALMIADAMRLEEREKQKLKYAATLHDIGKIGIAGRVLNKPGALTEEEYSHVKTHPLLGDSIIEPVEFLQEPRPIILHHHERYDGKGYPEGLKGEDIPLCARILSVADAFEAMRSDRPYRRALPLAEAVEELRRNAGTQFDPAVVEVFLSVLEGHGGDPVNR